MAKKAPSGFGIWIAFEEMITPGASVQKSILQAKKIGAKWVAVRGGGNRNASKTEVLRDAGLPVGAIKQYKDAGLDVYVWVFSYPEASCRASEIELYKQFKAEGADGIIVNAEVHWKIKDCDAIAAAHVKNIRAALGDMWVAHAPFALPMFHYDFPYKGFAGLDAVLAQLYWTEFNNNGLKSWLDVYDKQWKTYKASVSAVAHQPVHPIGVSYGSELGPKWKMKQVPPGVIHVSDVDLFMDHFADDPMPSLYTLEAMSDDVRAYLEARAENSTVEDKMTDTKPEEKKSELPQAHLPANGKTTRANPWGQAYRITEEFPAYDGSPESILNIVKWLGVEKGGRWRPQPGTTFCNVYAHDLCNAVGAYVPRVWWNRIDSTSTAKAELGKTVHEMSANSLFRWFVEHSEKFGWKRVQTLTELQNAANSGRIGVIVGRNRVESAPGHISCVVPESERCKAKRSFHDQSRVDLPVQSQAGGTNYELSNISSWWTSGTFAEDGFWTYEPPVPVFELEPIFVEDEDGNTNPENDVLAESEPKPAQPPPDVSAGIVVAPQPPHFLLVLIELISRLIAVVFGKKN